jgi:hypothetical protein
MQLLDVAFFNAGLKLMLFNISRPFNLISAFLDLSSFALELQTLRHLLYKNLLSIFFKTSFFVKMAE